MSTPEKPDPDRAVRFLANLVTDAEVDAEEERLAGLSDDELRAEVTRQGRDPSRTRTPGETLARVMSRGERQRRGGRVVWMRRATRALAFIAAALVVVFAVVRLRTPNVGTGTPPAAGTREAAKLRKEAVGKCGEQAWAACRDLLDRAKALDPLGDKNDDVTKARDEIARGLGSGGR
jgi:hypothetical protein